MPSKECLRRHHEGGPAVPGEHSARRSEERPIAISEVRSAYRATKHLELAAAQRVLELELADGPRLTNESDQANQVQIRERQHGGGMLLDEAIGAPSEYWRPTRREELPARLHGFGGPIRGRLSLRATPDRIAAANRATSRDGRLDVDVPDCAGPCA